MNREQILAAISQSVGQALTDKGLPGQDISAETVLLGSSLGVDSLDLATVVIQLTEATGRDPFEKGFVEFRTVGELADLFNSQATVQA